VMMMVTRSSSPLSYGISKPAEQSSARLGTGEGRDTSASSN
jgi:hypothetical protein